MRLERRIPRRRSLALTSLIDVIFILLLFFLLTSTFTRFGELPLATASAGVTPSDTAPVFVRLSEEAVSLNGRLQDLSSIAAALDAFAPRDGGTATVLIALEDGVASQRLVDLLVRLDAVDWAAVTVLGGTP